MEKNNITTILYKLLYDYKFRGAFINNEIESLNLTEEQKYSLHTIDKVELEAMANKIIRDFMHMNAGFGGELYQSFQGFFKLITNKGEDTNKIVKEFLRSNQFEKYHIIAYNGLGITLQEAFYNFLYDSINLYISEHLFEEIIRHDFLSSIFKMISANKNPSFRINSYLIETNENITFSIQHYTSDFLKILGIDDKESAYIYASTQSKFIMGQIGIISAEIIKQKERNLHKLANNLEIPYEILNKKYKSLESLGLVTSCL